MNIKKNIWAIIAGVVVGAIAVLLTACGNPANMGFCIACFLRDMAGAVKLHGAAVVQYVRPEIIGLTLGAMGMAMLRKEFSAKGGSAPMTRFVLGFFVMIGALVFLGCPLRMMLRIGGGDLNAIIGLVGFVAGIAVGIIALNRGFSLGRTHNINKMEGYVFPAINVAMLILLVATPAVLLFSEKGPGSQHAPILIALAASLVVGAVAQRTRLCTVAGIRDSIMFKDFYMLYAFIAIIATTLVGNAILGNLKFSFEGQPIAHTDFLWNFLGMVLVGVGSVLLGGCPLRQLILAGSGNSDSAVTVIGLVAGAAFAHNFGLASSADGPTDAGRIAVMIGFAVVAIIIFTNMKRRTSK